MRVCFPITIRINYYYLISIPDIITYLRRKNFAQRLFLVIRSSLTIHSRAIVSTQAPEFLRNKGYENIFTEKHANVRTTTGESDSLNHLVFWREEFRRTRLGISPEGLERPSDQSTIKADNLEAPRDVSIVIWSSDNTREVVLISWSYWITESRLAK